MTTPERKIQETVALLDRDEQRLIHQRELSRAERQILSNQLTILSAVKVLLSWDQE